MNEELFKILGEKRPSYRLRHALDPILQRQNPIEHVNLINEKLDWYDLSVLLLVLQTSKSSLKSLGIDGDPKLTDESLSSLFSCLQTAPKLEALDLTVTSIGREGLISLTSLIRSHPSLRSIYLHIDNLDSSNIRQLIGAIRSNPRIIRIGIHSSQLDDIALRELINLLRDDKFGTVDFGCEAIGAECCHSLAQQLSTLRNLTSFGLSVNSCVNLREIVDGLRDNPAVQDIAITDRLSRKISESLQTEIDRICQNHRDLTKQIEIFSAAATQVLEALSRARELATAAGSEPLLRAVDEKRDEISQKLKEPHIPTVSPVGGSTPP